MNTKYIRGRVQRKMYLKVSLLLLESRRWESSPQLVYFGSYMTACKVWENSEFFTSPTSKGHRTHCNELLLQHLASAAGV